MNTNCSFFRSLTSFSSLSLFPFLNLDFCASSEPSSLLINGTHPAVCLSNSPPRATSRLSFIRIGFPSTSHNRFKVLCNLNKEVPIIEARCMEEICNALAERLFPMAFPGSNPNFKYIVGLAGPPGAGKSTLASEVAYRINTTQGRNDCAVESVVKPPDVAIVLPMDGFHLYRSQLDAMENPKEAHARRGAPFTFDPARLLKCLETLRSQGSVYVPSFDHGVGDPVEDDIFVSLQHKIVIVEGNYLLLEEGAWKDVSSVFDEKWFIELDTDTAMERVLKRHISTGKHPDVAKWRIEYNDRPNAELINKSKKNAYLVIRSVDFQA